jgi:hypothetical protein
MCTRVKQLFYIGFFILAKKLCWLSRPGQRFGKIPFCRILLIEESSPPEWQNGTSDSIYWTLPLYQDLLCSKIPPAYTIASYLLTRTHCSAEQTRMTKCQCNKANPGYIECRLTLNTRSYRQRAAPLVPPGLRFYLESNGHIFSSFAIRVRKAFGLVILRNRSWG